MADEFLDPQHREAVIRTLLGEAATQPDEGQAAVAHVIRNRVNAGTYGPDPTAVVQAPAQFEPWGTPAGRQRMFGYATDSPAYQKAAAIVDGVFAGSIPDPTGGAVNFLNPTLQTQLGRNIPSWAQGLGQRIGDHVFFGGAPQGAQQPFIAPQMAAPQFPQAGPQAALRIPQGTPPVFPGAPTTDQPQDVQAAANKAVSDLLGQQQQKFPQVQPLQLAPRRVADLSALQRFAMSRAPIFPR